MCLKSVKCKRVGGKIPFIPSMCEIAAIQVTLLYLVYQELSYEFSFIFGASVLIKSAHLVMILILGQVIQASSRINEMLK